MTTQPQSTSTTVQLDTWTLLRPMTAPAAGVRAFVAVDSTGQQGWLRTIERSAMGPDGGVGLLEQLRRLDRVRDSRVSRLLGGGMSTLEGKDVLYAVFTGLDATPAGELVGPQGGALMPREVLAVLVQAGDALAAAHGVGVAHGNVCPSALYLGSGKRLLLGEFGMAPWSDGVPARACPAPELRAGGTATFAGDVFSLALTGAALLCGTDMLTAWTSLDGGAEGADVMVALEKQGQLPAEAIRAIVGALHPDPLARPAAGALAASLRAFAGDLPEVSQPAEPAASGRSDPIESWLRTPSVPGGVAEISSPAMRLPPVTQPSLPAPPAAFLVEKTMDMGSDVLEEAPATPASVDAPLPETTGPFVHAPPPSLPPHTLPPMSMPPQSVVETFQPKVGSVPVNLAAARALLPSNAEFPLVAMWTERPNAKAPPVVEWKRPAVATAVATSQNRALHIGMGLVFGLLSGFVLWHQGAPAPVPPGVVHVESTLTEPPVDVEVLLDGKKLGKAPVTAQNVTPGPHVVVLTTEGAEPRVVPLDVTPGAVVDVKDAPELFAARLVVTSAVKGGTVTLGVDGPSRNLPAEFEDLEPGAEVELVFHQGKDTVKRVVRLPAGELHFHVDSLKPGAPGATRVEDAAPAPKGGAVQEAAPAPTPVEAAASPAAAANAAEEEALGRKALLEGKFDSAEKHTRAAVTLDPSRADAVKTLGIIMVRNGKHCEGVKFYRKYLEMRPSASDVDRVRTILRDLETKAPDCR